MSLINVVSESSVVIQASFYNPDGDLVVPDSITWSLCETDGTIVNEREDVEIDTPASAISILLSGDDLPNDISKAYLAITAIYDSDYGDDAPMRKEVEINITGTINE